MISRYSFLKGILQRVNDKEFYSLEIISKLENDVFTLKTTNNNLSPAEHFKAGDNIAYIGVDETCSGYGVIEEIKSKTEIVIAGLPDGAAGTEGDYIFTIDNLKGALQDSILFYSKYRPYIQVLEKNIVNSLMEITEEFYPNFTIIKNIEYPIGMIPESYVIKNLYQVKQDLEEKIYVSFDVVLTGLAKITMTSPHKESSDDETIYNFLTIPETDFESICDLAASFYLGRLASTRANEINQIVGSDIKGSGKNKMDNYLSLATYFLKKFCSFFNLDYENLVIGKLNSDYGSDSQDTDESLKFPKLPYFPVINNN